MKGGVRLSVAAVTGCSCSKVGTGLKFLLCCFLQAAVAFENTVLSLGGVNEHEVSCCVIDAFVCVLLLV